MNSKVGENVIMTVSYKDHKKEIVQELKVIAAREGKSTSALIMDLIEQYVKAHSSGNDTFKLDEWSLDAAFKAVPALLATDDKWINHYKDSTDKDKTELRIKVNRLNKLFQNIDFNSHKKN